MPTRQISDKMSSGELISIKIGGTGDGKEVTLTEELTALADAVTLALAGKLDIDAVPVSRASFYMDVSGLEPERTTVIINSGERYDLVGTIIPERLINFTYSAGIFTYAGPDGYFDFEANTIQKSTVISLTTHLAIQYKPVGDPEEDPWEEYTMSKTGTFVKTAGEAASLGKSFADKLIADGDRFKFVTFANKTTTIITTHFSGLFKQYEIVT